MKMKKIFKFGLLAVVAAIVFTSNAIAGEAVNLLPDFFIGGGAILADAFAGASETTQGTATVAQKPEHNKASVDKVLHKIMPSQFPMDEMLRHLSTAKTESTKYEYFKVRARGISASVAATVEPASAPNATPIKCDSVHIFSKDGNILVPGYNATGVDKAATAVSSGSVAIQPLILHICEINRTTNTIMVIPLNASGVPAMSASTKLFRMGTAKHELAAISEDPLSQPVKDYNLCQIHMTTVSEGVYQKLQEKEVPYGIAEFKEQALYDFRMTNEIDAIFGVRSEFTDPEGKTKFTSDGLVRKVNKHLDKGDAASVTEDILLGWSADVFDGNNGSDERILLYGTEFGKAIANCRTIYKSLEAGKTEVKFGITFNRIETNFGTFLLKYHGLLNAYGYGAAGIVVDPANVYRCIQKPLEATELNLDQSGQSRSKDIRIDESHTLAVTNPETHAILFA